MKIRQYKKEYVNSNGEIVNLVLFKGKVKKYVLETEKKNLTPIFDSIKYNKANEAFLVKQSYQDFYEDGRESTMTDNLYFYVDFSGKPISPGYSEFLDKFLPVKLVDEEAPGKDRWFSEWGVTQRNIGLELGLELDKRRQKINPSMIKMLKQDN